MTDTAARVKKMLRSGGATAAQVADALCVSRPTAYKHLKALRADADVICRREQVSARGPKSKVYSMADRRLK